MNRVEKVVAASSLGLGLVVMGTGFRDVVESGAAHVNAEAACNLQNEVTCINTEFNDEFNSSTASLQLVTGLGLITVSLAINQGAYMREHQTRDQQLAEK